MQDPRQHHGTHTWDLILSYRQCPECGQILEDRTKFIQESNLLCKNLVCERCKKPFRVTKKVKHKFLPLFGSD